MLTQKQIGERLSGIGSSDASCVLGVNPYRSADDVLREKLGLAPPFEGNEATYWGDFMEPHLRKEYEKRSGFPVKAVKKMYRHPKHKYMIAHIDGLILKPEGYGVLEIKTMRFAPKDIAGHYHTIQLQHGMAVTGCLWGCLAILMGGNEFKLFEFQRDDELIEAMIGIQGKFWERVKQARKEAA